MVLLLVQSPLKRQTRDNLKRRTALISLPLTKWMTQIQRLNVDEASVAFSLFRALCCLGAALLKARQVLRELFHKTRKHWRGTRKEWFAGAFNDSSHSVVFDPTLSQKGLHHVSLLEAPFRGACASNKRIRESRRFWGSKPRRLPRLDLGQQPGARNVQGGEEAGGREQRNLRVRGGQ